MRTMSADAVRRLSRAQLPQLPPLRTGSTRLYLARHGETDWNLEARIQGSTCKPLNATGIAQARALADVLADTPLHLIVTSPLRRASQTAELVRDRHPSAAWHEDERFAEMNFGEIEGHTLEEYADTYADTLKVSFCDEPIVSPLIPISAGRAFESRLQAWAAGDLELCWPGEGGESCRDVADRALAGLEALGLCGAPASVISSATSVISSATHRHVLIVAHSRLNKSLLAALHGDLSRCSDVQQGNTCLNILDIGADGTAETVLLNYREHVAAPDAAWS